jgi:hypothetical protein
MGVSFVGFIMLTKSLLCNVTVLNRDAILFRISSLLEFISLRWKESYYDKFQCHMLQESYFRDPGRFCADSNSAKVGSFVSVRTTHLCVWALISVEKLLNSSSVHSSERQSNTVRTPVRV